MKTINLAESSDKLAGSLELFSQSVKRFLELKGTAEHKNQSGWAGLK